MSHQLFDQMADVGSSEDEDYEGGVDDTEQQGETKQRKKKTNGVSGEFEDSSEEEEEDDEARLRLEGEGFVVDDEEEEEEEIDHGPRRKKRRRKERERSDDALDEEDLDLIGGHVEQRAPTQSKYKRLKRGHRERSVRERGVEELFSDDDEENEDAEEDRRGGRAGLADEFADFIEEDQFEDELEDDRDVAQPGVSTLASGLQAAGFDEGAEEDYRGAFGDSTEYDWALGLQEEQEEPQEGEGGEIRLEDVFEPAQLEDRMLTAEDNVIRTTDIPERLQIARKPFQDLELTEEQMEDRLNDEARWVTQLIWPKKRLVRYYAGPFKRAVKKVLYFLTIEHFEVPFIFNHRKDYLIHAPGDHVDDQDDPDELPMDEGPQRLLVQSDLWEIFDLDLKYRAMVEKRDGLQRTYDSLKAINPTIHAKALEDLINKTVTLEEVQELQEYLHFQYSAEMKDLRSLESQSNGTQKRAQGVRSFYERLRSGNAYHLVRAFGITADDFAQNCEDDGMTRRRYTEDPQQTPEELADGFVSPPEFSTTSDVLSAAKATFVQELAVNPRFRRLLRANFYEKGLIDCIRTDKGARLITEDHPYYEYKYLRNQGFHVFSTHPEMFLKMLKAEEENMIQIRVKMNGYEAFKQKLYGHIVSDGISEVAEAWNALRRDALDSALELVGRAVTRGVKDNLRAECEKQLASIAREKFYNKLDQAPYRPKGTDPGTIPEVLTISNYRGRREDATCWVFMNSSGRILEHGKFTNLRLGNRDKGIPDSEDIDLFREVVERRHPDVIGVSGFTVETRRLYKELQEIVKEHDLRGPEYEDPDKDGAERSDPLEVIMVNDEVARHYMDSPRAVEEFPELPSVSRYCVALARYLQNPLLEYASMGDDIVTLPLVKEQTLLPKEKLLENLQTAMVDMVNLVGVEINDAYADPYVAKVLPFVCGLGHRKADQLLKTIKLNGGQVLKREDLLGFSTTDNRELKQAMGPVVFSNCASFLYVRYESNEEQMDYLDNTRVHPEDYDLARKMVADALEMDEEDVKAEVDEGGPSAVVHKMIREDANDKIHDLILEDYATEIEKKIGSRKRATLETIRAELLNAYEEIRQAFSMMSSDEIFVMLTGETKESLTENMVVPVQIKRTWQDRIEVKLECGIDGTVSNFEFPEGVGNGGLEPRQAFQIHQTVPAKILHINRKGLIATLSLRGENVRKHLVKQIDRQPGEWDFDQETADKKAAQRGLESKTGRPQRIVSHPLFFQFNSAQAEEYLGSKEPGDVVIRPSSKGFDHLAVTWKVADGIYQHIDVLELGKDNEYSLGKQLRVGKMTYTDLDELIVNHVQAMARKVTEIMKDERFQKGSKESTEQWLKTYTEANPKRFMYAFCVMPKFPGYFWLVFRAGFHAKPGAWPIKVIPNAFELKNHAYPDMKSLKNGFKILMGTQTTAPPNQPGVGVRPGVLPTRAH